MKTDFQTNFAAYQGIELGRKAAWNISYTYKNRYPFKLEIHFCPWIFLKTSSGTKVCKKPVFAFPNRFMAQAQSEQFIGV